MVQAKFFNVHWDGKMLMDFAGTEKVDRLPVIATYDGNEQLLGVPKLPSGKGKGQKTAEAVYELLHEWKIVDRVQAISFDTTSTNTGVFNGAAILLEKLLQRDLFYVACRHHIYELILKAAFEAKFGRTTGPGVPIFSRFKEQYKNVENKTFTSGITDHLVAIKIPIDVQKNVSEFCFAEINTKQPRDDYREFLLLTLLFIGEKMSFYKIKPPGPISHARWMAKAIYCLKIFLFREHFELNDLELNGIRYICIFIVSLYVKAWFGSVRAVEAPNNDLNFLKAAIDYKSIDSDVSQKVLAKFCGHLWYLSGEAVALSLFDEKLSIETKRKIVNAINEIEHEKKLLHEEDSEDEDSGSDDSSDDLKATEEDYESDNDNGKGCLLKRAVGSKGPKRLQLTLKDMDKCFMKKNLSDFVTADTIKLFERFGLSKAFLSVDAETWSSNESYQKARDIVLNLHVVNDAAERGVKLIETYNKVLCRNESEKQFLLQVVSENRKIFPSHDKKKLM